MSGTQRTLEFILSWQDYSVGERITPNAAHGDWLIANGYCKPVDEKAKRRPKAEAKSEAAPAAGPQPNLDRALFRG